MTIQKTKRQYELSDLHNDLLCNCGQNWAWHVNNKPKHPFIPPKGNNGNADNE